MLSTLHLKLLPWWWSICKAFESWSVTSTVETVCLQVTSNISVHFHSLMPVSSVSNDSFWKMFCPWKMRRKMWCDFFGFDCLLVHEIHSGIWCNTNILIFLLFWCIFIQYLSLVSCHYSYFALLLFILYILYNLLAPSSSAALAPGSYATLGRPASLPVSKQQRHLSSSDPDLPSSNLGSPDNEVSNLMGGKFYLFACHAVLIAITQHLDVFRISVLM